MNNFAKDVWRVRRIHTCGIEMEVVLNGSFPHPTLDVVSVVESKATSDLSFRLMTRKWVKELSKHLKKVFKFNKYYPLDHIILQRQYRACLLFEHQLN